MAIDYNTIIPPEAFDAASLNDRFTAVKNGVNSIPVEAFDRGALNENHLAGLLKIPYGTRIMTAGTNHTYSNSWVGTPGSTLPGTGWVVIDQGTTALSDTFSAYQFDTDPSYIQGVVLMANVEMTGQTDKPIAMFAFQWQEGGTTWHTIARSVRMVSPALAIVNTTAFPLTFDVAIRSLFLPADVTAGANITGFRVVTAMHTDSSGAAPDFKLNRGNFTHLPLFGKVV